MWVLCGEKREILLDHKTHLLDSKMHLTGGIADGHGRFGWRLHLVIDEVGLPANLSMLPAGFHDLTPVHELTFELPVEARVFLDKAYNAKADELSILEETGVVLTPIRKANMVVQNTITEMFDLAKYRRRVETVGSQLVAMGLQEIRARTNAGFFLKVIAALFALFVTNALAL